MLEITSIQTNLHLVSWGRRD